MILKVVCNDPTLQNILAITKRFLTLIQIVGPIICIIMLTIIFIQLISNPEDKKIQVKIKNCLLSLFILFIIPLLVDVSMRIADDSVKISSCWKNAEHSIDKGEFVESEGNKKTPILVHPDEYEDGKEKDNNNRR